jgi:O-acetyl-ADP-ribose deacetylase (regulator of RNase III)
MSTLQVIDGNIFTSQAQTLVNTVNCFGVMGAGIALECRLRFPEMYDQYVTRCNSGQTRIGSLWLFKASGRWILNFPTKLHWKDQSKEAYLHEGLQEFMKTYEEQRIESIAFPLLGAQNGGLDRERAQDLMQSYLQKCRIPVEIFRYDPSAPDDLFDRFRAAVLKMNPDEVRAATGLRSNQISKVIDALQSPNLRQLNQLAAWPGIGFKTLERVFRFANSQGCSSPRFVQQNFEF